MTDEIIDAEERSQSCDGGTDARGEQPLSVQAEFHRLDARYAALRADVTDRKRRMERIEGAYRVLTSAVEMDGSLDYSTLTRAAEFEDVDLGRVLDVLDNDVVDVPEWARCDTLSSSH